MFLCLWHLKKSFWQHAGKCVNTSVFARPGPQNTVNTVIFASRGSKPRKYRGFALARSQKHRHLRCFFCSENVKNRGFTAYLTLFGGLQKPSVWRFWGVCKKYQLQRLQRHRQQDQAATAITTNNNNDDDAADDDEDDDNNDNDDNDGNDDSYLVQMKSPSLFPSPDPYRHRRCAKLYNYPLNGGSSDMINNGSYMLWSTIMVNY